MRSVITSYINKLQNSPISIDGISIKAAKRTLDLVVPTGFEKIIKDLGFNNLDIQFNIIEF